MADDLLPRLGYPGRWMTKVGEPGKSNVVMDFAKGVVLGSHGPDASVAQVVGDVAGALIPGLGELKALQDIWEGSKSGDPALLLGGVIGLVPVVGAAGKAGGKAASKAGAKLTAEVAEKGLSQGLKVSALQLSRAAQVGVKKTLADPKTKQRLMAAAEQAGQRGLNQLLTSLADMQTKGVQPTTYTREHETFEQARNAAFQGMGGRPTKDWNDLVLEAEGGARQVVGRHEDGARGFRFLATPPAEGQDKGPLQLFWWKGGADGQLSLGVERCEMAPEAVGRIQEAYLNRDKSFRRKVSG
jgi:hypothetical protein